MDSLTDDAQASQRQTLGLKFAESRVPETPILDAGGLTKAEAVSLVDLARYWARIGKTGSSYQHPPTSECLPVLLKAVFEGWDSTEGEPAVPKEAGRKKEGSRILVGTWEGDLRPSIAETTGSKRKQAEDAEESQKKKPSARKRGADAWLTLTIFKEGGYKYMFRDASFRTAPKNKVIIYNPGMSEFKAMKRCITIYDLAEKDRVNGFNRRLVLAIARKRISRFAQSGNVGDDESLPEIDRDDSIEERFVVLRLARDAINEQWGLLGRLLNKPGNGSS
ncbi:hypothetical protein LRP88_13378 [Fusarium phalaenopsidis]